MSEGPKGMGRSQNPYFTPYKVGRRQSLGWGEDEPQFTKQTLYLDTEEGDLVVIPAIKNLPPQEIIEEDDVLILTVDKRGWCYRNTKTSECITITGYKEPPGELQVEGQKYVLMHNKRGFIYFSSKHNKNVVRDPKLHAPEEVTLTDADGEERTYLLVRQKHSPLALATVGADPQYHGFTVHIGAFAHHENVITEMMDELIEQVPHFPSWYLRDMTSNRAKDMKILWGRVLDPMLHYTAEGVIKMAGPVIRWGPISEAVQIKGSEDGKTFGRFTSRDDIQDMVDAPLYTKKICCAHCGRIYYVPTKDKYGRPFKYWGDNVCWLCDPWVIVMITMTLFVPMRLKKAREFEANRGKSKNKRGKKPKTELAFTNASKKRKSDLLAKYVKEGKIKLEDND
jgi:hypothetical protein